MLTIGNLNIPNFPLLLAPMEDVSDPPFRVVCKENGADIMYTEFISSEALIRDAAPSVAKLDIFEMERPIGIQIFGHDIDSMRAAIEITEKVKPDIIDINYGCPVKKVTCKGAGGRYPARHPQNGEDDRRNGESNGSTCNRQNSARLG